MKRLNIYETADYLHISVATVKNWMRSGRLVPTEGSGESAVFSVEQLSQTVKQNRKEGKLKSRRNKSAVLGTSPYKGYLSSPLLSPLDYQKIVSAVTPASKSNLRGILAHYAADFFRQLGKDAPYIQRLLTELKGNTVIPSDFSLSLPALSFKAGEDLLGYLYISLSELGRRKKNGVYYTPVLVVDRLLKELEPIPSLSQRTITDPACGSGNFFVRLRSFHSDPSRFYGRDTDEIALLLCRINIALNYEISEESSAFLWTNFTKSDSLSSFPVCHEDLAVYLGNPPWGANVSYPKTKLPKELFRKDSAALFLWKTIEQMKEGDVVSYVLPASFLSVHLYGFLREKLCSETAVTSVVFLDNTFFGVDCPSVLLTATRKAPSIPMLSNCRISKEARCFTIQNRVPIHPDFYMFHAEDSAYEIIQKIRSLDHTVTLKGNAEFALGIVTGDNRKFLLPPIENAIVSDSDMLFDDTVASDGNTRLESKTLPGNNALSPEPVLKGENLVPYGILPPYHRILFSPENFQQCAPPSRYRAEEKIVYRFISSTPVFAFDTQKRVTLNSCNILIPRLPGLSAKYVLAVLNSRVAAYYFKTCFASVKMLRTHIESLPIPIPSENKQKKIELLVNQLLTLREKSAIIGTSSEREASHNFAEYERYYNELDEMILKLYHLSYDDILYEKNREL